MGILISWLLKQSPHNGVVFHPNKSPRIFSCFFFGGGVFFGFSRHSLFAREFHGAANLGYLGCLVVPTPFAHQQAAQHGTGTQFGPLEKEPFRTWNAHHFQMNHVSVLGYIFNG